VPVSTFISRTLTSPGPVVRASKSSHTASTLEPAVAMRGCSWELKIVSMLSLSTGQEPMFTDAPSSSSRCTLTDVDVSHASNASLV